jgi:hypothetical protein
VAEPTHRRQGEFSRDSRVPPLTKDPAPGSLPLHPLLGEVFLKNTPNGRLLSGTNRPKLALSYRLPQSYNILP